MESQARKQSFSNQAQLATYRVFLALKRMSVKDTRVLNGNLDTWIDNGEEVEQEVNLSQSENEFGAKIAKEVGFIIPMPKELITKQKKGLKLVSNRAWESISERLADIATSHEQESLWGRFIALQGVIRVIWQITMILMAHSEIRLKSLSYGRIKGLTQVIMLRFIVGHGGEQGCRGL